MSGVYYEWKFLMNKEQGELMDKFFSVERPYYVQHKLEEVELFENIFYVFSVEFYRGDKILSESPLKDMGYIFASIVSRYDGNNWHYTLCNGKEIIETISKPDIMMCNGVEDYINEQEKYYSKFKKLFNLATKHIDNKYGIEYILNLNYPCSKVKILSEKSVYGDKYGY